MNIFLRLLKIGRKYYIYLLGLVFCFIVSVSCAMIMPNIQKHIIDDCFIDLNFDKFWYFIFLYLVCLAFRMVTGFYQTYFAVLYAEYNTYDLRNKLFDHIQRLSFAYHNKIEAGQLISRSTADMEGIRNFYGEATRSFVGCSLVFFGSLISCFCMSVKLSLVVFILSPILGFVAVKYSNTIRPYFSKVQNQIGDLTTFLNQNLLGIKVVKSFVRESDQINTFRKLADNLYVSYVDTSKVTSVYSPLISLIAAFSHIIIFFYGGYLAIKGEMTVGGVVAFITYFSMIIWPLNAIAMIVALIQNGLASAERIFDILKIKPEKIIDGNTVLNVCHGNIEFNNVSFEFSDGYKALSNINLKVNSGEMVGIIGATGSGKTTLVNLLCRFYDVSDGELLIDGKNIKEYTLDSLRHHVGIVAQETFLFGDTIKNNISYPKNASLEEVIEVAKAANIHDYIMSLPNGYDTQIGERGVDLSGGQKQRMSIARALLLNPDILIFDDSTSALDTHTEALIQNAISNLVEERTTFMITQRVSAIKNADKIIVIDKGKIVEEGTHNQLIETNGVYKKIYDSQLLSNEYEEEK